VSQIEFWRKIEKLILGNSKKLFSEIEIRRLFDEIDKETLMAVSASWAERLH
jgi:hypothetical protein